MTQPNSTKLEIINNTLDIKIKNLEPKFRSKIVDQLMTRTDISSITKCASILSKELLDLPGCSMGTKSYWLSRGWDELNAEIKAKTNMKVINDRVKRDSPYSINFWEKKTNEKTGFLYTPEEAEYERNSRRPIRKEYWIKKGYTEEESINLAVCHKENNNKKGAIGSKSRSVDRIRAHSHRTVEYWILRGLTYDEARQKVSEGQMLFSKETCIKKYGEKEGLRVWSERQIKWLESLRRSGIHSGFSKISMELFEQLSCTHPSIQYGKNEATIKGEIMSYSIDCVELATKKIIEFYGDYWHANPNKFNADDTIKKKTAAYIWNHDHTKITDLEQLGYKVMIVWEYEYKSDKQGILNKCKQFLTA
jgi:G:T-mismatch repair DNA endonuclease (very short patch repair protein)